TCRTWLQKGNSYGIKIRICFMLKNETPGRDTLPPVNRSGGTHTKKDLVKPPHDVADVENSQPAIALPMLIGMFLAVIGGAFVAIDLLPVWVPSLSASFQ